MLKRISFMIVVLIILSLALSSIGLAQEDVQTAANGYFGTGTKNIKAADLFEVLNDGDTSNDPFIIDARTPEDYAVGHIPGAVNIGAKVAFTPEKLASIPKDKPVVVYCYTGQTSSQMVPVLNMLGYDAKSMLFGFPAWAPVEGIKGQLPFDAKVDQSDYKVSAEAAQASETFDPAAPLAGTVADAAAAYFADGTKNIKASDVFDNLNDGDPSNDPFVMDVRKAEDYQAGHVPGAINYDPKVLFTVEQLATIPANKPVVVYCYTGQTASQVTSVLNMLGYDASNLKFGFASWSPSGQYAFKVATDSGNFKYEGAVAAPAAAAPAPEAPAALPATGGVLFDASWIYLLLGSGLLGAGLSLRRS